MKKISINKIAELAGVSKTTVSFVLNGRGNEKNISQATQRKITAIAKDNNYQANHLARSLSIGKSYTIGFIVPDISNPFYSKIARFVEQFAEEKGYSVMIASSGEDVEKEKKLLNGFKSRLIDGVILASSSKSYNQLKNLNTKNLPTIYFDRVYKEQKELFVDVNNALSAKHLTQTLINRGHKKIGMITVTPYLPNIKQRINGFKEALQNNSIALNPNHIIEVDHQYKKQHVQKAVKQLLSNSNNVSAILFVNNVLAAEGIWAIHKNHLELSEKIEFASFDNLELFDYSKPKVISALQPTNEIAQKCVDMLCQQIEKPGPCNGVQFETSIIKR